MADAPPPRRLRSVPAGSRAARATAPDRGEDGGARRSDGGGAITIRTARPDEAEAVAGVYLASRRHAGALIPRGPYTDDDVRTWFATIVLVDHETVVAERERRIVAVLVLRGESLDQLYVHPDYQRRGIGSRLVAYAKARRRRIRLYTFAANEPARTFYEQHGFRAIAFGDGTTNDEGAPDVLYEWTAR